MNSLATMACASQLSKALGLHIRPTDVLAHASPAALAEALYERVHGRAASSTAATAVEHEDDPAVSTLATMLEAIRSERDVLERTAVSVAHAAATESKSIRPSDGVVVPHYARIGGGGHASEVIMTMSREGRCKIIGVFDDNEASHGCSVQGVRVVGAIASIPVEAHWLICIGQNEVRQKIAEQFDAKGANRGSPFWPHNETVVPRDSTVGEGTFIAAGVVIGPRVTIGRHCILQPGCLLGHDVVVHDYAFVGGRAMLAGFAIVEEGAVVGMAAVVAPKVRVGAWSTVMIQSAAVADVPAGVACGGVPAVVFGVSERTKVG